MTRADSTSADAALLAKALWESESVGVARLDDRGRVVEANPTLERIAGRPLSGAAGDELVVQAQRPLDELGDGGSARVTILRDEQVGTGDHLLTIHRDGEERILVLEPLVADTALLTDRLLELNDELVSAQRELRRQRDRLAAQNDELQALDRLKDELLAIVSHELRTPLASLMIAVEILRDEGERLSDRGREYLGVIDRNSGRLLRLVDDLLLLARAEAGRVTLARVPVDLGVLARQAAAAVGPPASEAGVSVGVAAHGNTVLEGDAGRLEQLLDNLLSNAVKFTPGGGSAELVVTGRPESVDVAVRDDGIGIPAEDVGRIFDRFFRGLNAERRSIGGTGLGLAVVKAIAEAHGGRVVVESAEGAGTTVYVSLPRRTAQAAR